MLKEKKILEINALFLATCPIWSVYDILPGNSLSTIFVVLLVLLNFKRINKMVARNPLEINLFLGIFFIGAIGFVFNGGERYFNNKTFINNLYPILIFSFAVLLLLKKIDLTFYKKTVFYCGFFISIIVIFQKIQHILTGSYFNNFFIPGIPLYRDLEKMSIQRPSACFSEPAHLSLYLLPVFYLCLKQKKWFCAVIIGFGILCSGSSTGLILLLCLLFLYRFNSKISFLGVFSSCLLIAIIVAFVLYFMPSISNVFIERYFQEEDDSLMLRIFGPFKYLSDFNTLQLIIGIGFNQLSDFCSVNNHFLVSAWGNEISSNYANAMLFMMISYGLVGEFLFVRYIFKMHKFYTPDNGIFVIFLAILFTDQVLFNMNLLYLFTFTINSSPIFLNNEEIRENNMLGVK